MAELRQTLAADIGGLEAARLRGRVFLAAEGVDERTIALVELVAEEAMTNVLRYGYRDTGLRWIEFVLTVQADAVDLLIEDDGVPFDPLSVPEPTLPRTLDEARIGGLGLLMIRRSTRSMRYERREGRNRLWLAVGRSAEAAPAASAQIDPVR